MFKPLSQPLESPARILVICSRRIGDVLLCTVLTRSLKAAYPQARIDMLTNRSSAAVLEGNPDLDQVLEMAESPTTVEFLRLAARLFRRYSLAVCTMASDRQQVLGFLAAPVRVSAVPPPGEPGARWKRWLARAWVMVDLGSQHAVVHYLRLADGLRIPRQPVVVSPVPAHAPPRPAEPYAVLHPQPMFRYKAWTRDGWVATARWLRGQGLQVVFSSGPDPREVAHVAKLVEELADPRVITTHGRLSLAQVASLIAGARVYVGPDTAVTHLAAATRVPTVAVFGPSPPVAWGPWPQDFSADVSSPWVMTAPLQHLGNVWIVQGITPCVPCLQEGCERNLNSRADCLDFLPAQRVIDAVAQALATPRAA